MPFAVRTLSAAKVTVPENEPATITPPSSSATRGLTSVAPPAGSGVPVGTAATIAPGGGGASVPASGARISASGRISGRPPQPAVQADMNAKTQVRSPTERIVRASIYDRARRGRFGSEQAMLEFHGHAPASLRA